jgi:hypothetical protein
MIEILNQLLSATFSWPGLGIFLACVLIDALWVAWFHHSERNNAWRSAGISMLMAGLSLVGIGAAIKDPLYAPVYILGLGMGSYLGVKLKGRRSHPGATKAHKRETPSKPIY